MTSCRCGVRRIFEVMSTLFILLFAVATVWGGFNESWDALINWERFGTAWNPPIPAITQPLILVMLTLITIQAISNLIMDWDTLGSGIELSEEMKAEVEEMKRAQGITDEDLQATTDAVQRGVK